VEPTKSPEKSGISAPCGVWKTLEVKRGLCCPSDPEKARERAISAASVRMERLAPVSLG
jgi:hypothetical protein